MKTPEKKPAKRSAGWAVIRAEAPVMPWELPTMKPDLADACRRVAAVRGTAVVLFFCADLLELQDRLVDAQGDGEPLVLEESEPIIRQHYHELEELHSHDYAQRFCRLWLCISDFLINVHKGRIARGALRKQTARVARR